MMQVKLFFCLLVLLYLFATARFCYAARSRFSGTVEVLKHLDRLNKPPIKSIQSPDGDIIDCVHMSHQPAFDHAFLKNHTIKSSAPTSGLEEMAYVAIGDWRNGGALLKSACGRSGLLVNQNSYKKKPETKWTRPNYHPNWINNDDIKVSSQMNPSKDGQPSLEKHETITQLWHSNGKCPKGTVPIRRTKKEDILRASSVKSYGKKKSFSTLAQPSSIDLDLINQNGHQHAIVYAEGQFYGAKATMNVWNPKIQQLNEFSLSQIWLLGGSFASDLNSIEAGWQVSPDLYGDNNTRLFIYWTSDAYQATGCYNLLCSGFIQVNNEIAIGGSISPISHYDGSQYDITILIWKDPEEGNWWMQFGNGKVLGYWPATLFSYLTESASLIEWGGEVVNTASDGQHTTTQMGSGEFPREGFTKASYFRNIQVVDESNNLRAPKDISTYSEQPNCYDVKTGSNGNWGNHFYYGGPGRSPKCP